MLITPFLTGLLTGKSQCPFPSTLLQNAKWKGPDPLNHYHIKPPDTLYLRQPINCCERIQHIMFVHRSNMASCYTSCCCHPGTWPAYSARSWDYFCDHWFRNYSISSASWNCPSSIGSSAEHPSPVPRDTVTRNWSWLILHTT